MKDRVVKEVHGPISSSLTGIPTDRNIKFNEASVKASKECEKVFGFSGKMEFAHKSDGRDYCEKKGWKFIPNANIFLQGGYKIWYGDFIINPKNTLKMVELAKELKKKLYLLWEMDGRFLEAPPTDDYLLAKAVFVADFGGKEKDASNSSN